MGPEGEILAAGGVVWRRRGDKTEVLLVHRPRYDDWSLPKGKVEGTEDVASAALREVAEETGYQCQLGTMVGEHGYRVEGRPKRVVFFLMEPLGGEFRRGAEVDALGWFTLERAHERLSHEGDRRIAADAATLLSDLT